jgi:hypothetical protein
VEEDHALARKFRLEAQAEHSRHGSFSHATRKHQLTALWKGASCLTDRPEGNDGSKRKLTGGRPPSDESRLPAEEPSKCDALL